MSGIRPPFTTDPGIMGDRTVFSCTPIPAEVLFEILTDGMMVYEILDSDPTLNRGDVLSIAQFV